jgi:Zn-dependent protease with chaperone function
MNELARVSRSVEIHLLYASIVWLAAWLLTSMRSGTATTKYWIWVAAALNFLLPLNAVPDRFWPSRLSWFASGSIADALERRISIGVPVVTMVLIVWALGATLMFVRLGARIHADRRHSFTTNHQSPAVRGLLRPQISLPEGIDELLTERELNAVLIHERTHAKRRDNLIRLIHELTLCALWFHPLVWITGSRLALYRELSCDESVTRRLHSSDLVSALAKLASPEHATLLQATASSFINDRLAYLAADESRESHYAANILIAIAFAAVLIAATVGPIAESAAAYACALTHAGRGPVR